MAYISQEKKKELAPAIKAVLKKYGIKGTIATRHHSTLVVNIKSGDIDLIAEANKVRKETAERRGTDYYEAEGNFQVNEYHPYVNASSPEVVKFYEELVEAMKGPDWFDKSDSQSDYFHIAWYLDINVGRWNKPFVYTGA